MRLVKNLLSCLAACALLFLCAHTYGQPNQLAFDWFTTENGLPDNQVRCVLQDRDGLLWVGRSNGISRFDGYEVESFRHDPVDTNTLAGNVIMTLFEDRKGRLWISSYTGGLTITNPQKNSFRRLSIWPDSIVPQITITEITQDQEDQIWLATNEGLFVLSEHDGKFQSMDLQQFLKTGSACTFPEQPMQLHVDQNGMVWIGSSEGLYAYDTAKKNLTCPDRWNGLPRVTINDIVRDRTDRLWVSTYLRKDRLYYFLPGENRFKLFSGIPFDTSSRVAQLDFDLDNRMWVSVFARESYGYDFRDSTIFFQSTTNPLVSHERFFRTPFIDHSGKVWLPCDGFLTYPYPKGFKSYRHGYPFHQSVTSIHFSDNTMWTGIREEGLIRLDLTSNQEERFHVEGTGKNYFPATLVVDQIGTRSGHMVAVAYGSILILDRDGRLIRSFEMPGSNRAAFEDSKGRLWVGAVMAMHLFSEVTGSVKSYKIPAATGDSRLFIQAIAEDKAGHIWFASGGRGLGRLNPETEEILHFKLQGTPPFDLPCNNIVDLFIDRNNVLWMATDIGLIMMDPETFEQKLYNHKSGLDHDFLCSVVGGLDGRIWMSAQGGISVLDPQTDKILNYSQADGLVNSVYYNRTSYVKEDGTIYFGGKYGIDYFKPDDLRSNPTAPKMLLSGLNLFRDGKPHAYELNGSLIQLSYKDDLVMLEFAGIHFSNQDKIRYQYRLDPLHEDWIDLGYERKVLFSNLKPGEYIFRVKAVTPDEVWSAADLEVSIDVSPPFYQTWWFRIAAMVLILGMVYGYIKYRERIVQKKEQKEAEVTRQLMELEKRALQAQMNPHFIYNSMNSIQQFILIHDTEGAMKYLTRFSRILRTVLNMSSQNRIPLFEELKLIEDYIELENMRFPNKFTYTIDVSPDLNIHAVEIPPFFIQPQVENAIRHGLLRKASPGHLQVELKKEGEHIYIVVEDDGIGRDAARAGKFKDVNAHDSKGLTIIEERLKHLNPSNGHHPFKIIDLYDNAHQPRGTRVEIYLPID